jgi:competence protein ComEC
MFKLILILFCAGNAVADEFIVWNVGQGQWTTDVYSEVCIHYDLGGEKNLSAKVLKYCQSKRNILLLSHWDWDHIAWAPSFAAKLNQVCLSKLPDGQAKTWKIKFLSQVPLCQKEDLSLLRKYSHLIYSPAGHGKNLSSNDLSQVSESIWAHVLIPGDSTISQERFWRDLASKNTVGLVLGHHGSRTSTSIGLLKCLPHLKWAVASARQQRYGHPHRQIIHLLQQQKIPLLKTEDWGSLHFLR